MFGTSKLLFLFLQVVSKTSGLNMEREKQFMIAQDMFLDGQNDISQKIVSLPRQYIHTPHEKM